jgi:hypothetical protein
MRTSGPSGQSVRKSGEIPAHDSARSGIRATLAGHLPARPPPGWTGPLLQPGCCRTSGRTGSVKAVLACT